MSQNTPTSPAPTAAPAQPPFPLVPNNTLITATPEEGRQLAVKMARLIVRYTQQDESRRKTLRDVYANDPGMLIALTQTVATEFATIAAANNYWRK
jgi:Hexameric tyrosine-coordinated heme protein (HTHP)